MSEWEKYTCLKFYYRKSGATKYTQIRNSDGRCVFYYLLLVDNKRMGFDNKVILSTSLISERGVCAEMNDIVFSL